jgi:hypothetical protein
MDMGLISYIQCSKKCCEQEEALYGRAKRVGAKENWKHRCAAATRMLGAGMRLIGARRPALLGSLARLCVFFPAQLQGLERS